MAELKRRSVFRVAAVYAGVGFVLVQATAYVFDALLFPPWAHRLFVVFVLLGFPVALVLAWAFELTPEGMRISRSLKGDGGGAEEGLAEGPGRPVWSRALVPVALVAAVGAGVAVAGWAAWETWLAPESARSADGVEAGGPESRYSPNRIAVLYFDSHDGSDELEAVARGLTEDLTHELSQVEGLDVVSRNAVKPYREGLTPLDSVARDLGVGTLVEGSVERSGDGLVVTAQLIDASSGSHITSERVKRAGDDLFRLRAEIVSDVVRTLRERLGQRIRVEEIRQSGGSPEAWKLYHAGQERYVEARETMAAGSREGARRLYRQADSLFARAEAAGDGGWVEPAVKRAWLAIDVARMGGLSVDQVEADALRRGLSHVARALETEPDSPVALEVRGVLRYRLSQTDDVSPDEARRFREAAVRDLERAVAEDRGLARAWATLAEIYRSRARFGEARMAAHQSREADPYLSNDHVWLFQSAHLALELENFESALEQARKGRTQFPDEPAYPALQLLIAAGHAGPTLPPDSAWTLLREVAGDEAAQRWPPGLLLVGSVLARAGLEDSARSVAARVREAATGQAMVRYYGANLHLLLGEHAEALSDLRAYLDDRPDERPYVAHDWWWKPLRADSAFRSLVGEDALPADPAAAGR